MHSLITTVRVSSRKKCLGGGVVASAVQNVLRLINSPEEVWPTAVSES